MKRMMFFLLVLSFILFAACPIRSARAEWSGVDETVIEKHAEEHGRVARDPFINTDKGDLLLFVFLLGGAVGGFVGGYYWRMLIEQKGSGIAKQEKQGT